MQIEEGKFYRTRGGAKVGPMYRNHTAAHFPWGAEGTLYPWTIDGMAYADGALSDYDLVAEWTDEPPAKSPKLPQDGQDDSEATETASDAEWASRAARNEKEGVSDSDGRALQADNTTDDGVEKAKAALQRHRDYSPLWEILTAAHQQSSQGKGRIRHANGKPWLEQPIMTIGRDVGLGYPTGQALKKITEAVGMVSRGERDAAVAELLGAIVYAAAAVQLVREGK